MCEKCGYTSICLCPDVEPTEANCIRAVIFLEERLDEFTTDKSVAVETLINEYCRVHNMCRPSERDPIGLCSCRMCEFGTSD